MRSRAGSAQHTCDEKVAVRPACPRCLRFLGGEHLPSGHPAEARLGRAEELALALRPHLAHAFPPYLPHRFAASDGVAPGPRPVLVLRSPGSSWWLRRPLLSGGALWRPEAVRLPSRLLRRLRPEIRNADAQASGPGQALLSRFLSHVASSLCVLAPSSLAGGPRTGQAPALAGSTPRRPVPHSRGPPPSRAARLPTRDGRSARW